MEHHLMENHCIMIAMECGQDEYIRALGGISSARCSLRWTTIMRWTTITSLNEIVKMKRKFTRNKDKDSRLCEGARVPTPPPGKIEISLYEKARLASTRSRPSSTLYTPGWGREIHHDYICVLIPHTSIYEYPEVSLGPPREPSCYSYIPACRMRTHI